MSENDRPEPPLAAAGFERELERLEAIVGELQQDGVDLDSALRLFEEGVRRLRAVTARLSSVEERVKLLLEDENGDFQLTDLDTDEDDA